MRTNPKGPSLPPIDAVVLRLANRADRREAEIQSDVREFLLNARLELHEEQLQDVHLEAPVGGGRRIDVEVGATVIEVKRNIRSERARVEAIRQLGAYVQARQDDLGCRYVGILTDGATWRCYHLSGGALSEVSQHELDETKPDAAALTDWLDGVLATSRGIKPTPDTVIQRLGATSSAYKLDRATLHSLFQANRHTEDVKTKRTLWSKLLSTALGTQFNDSDELFIEHTLLVNSAEIIAHAVIGLDVLQVSPASLLSGEQFELFQIFGVVERDFFDWVAAVPEGDLFIRALAKRLGRFDWAEVEHDVLKVLYESVIGAETRKALGEYYTPDWLAQKVVEQAIDRPLEQRILDPACGSGTFLFHSIRRVLAAADQAGLAGEALATRVTRSVVGMDLHPVAVTLARVTYLLAIGRERLRTPGRGPLRVPVFLGDSLQWRRQARDILNHEELRIAADDRREITPPEFRFPLALLANADAFDELVRYFAEVASGGRRPGTVPDIRAWLTKANFDAEHHEMLQATLATMCRLHDEGRDHIWGYYIRNLARPEWLAREENRVDVLVGNPPWLAFRFMPEPMQADFRSMSQARHIWHGAKVATQHDLSGLFVVRAVEQYLKDGGRFGMVMPSAVLNAGQFKGFRTGDFDHGSGELRVAFDTPWDLRPVRPHFFPITASVIFGQRAAAARSLPTAEVWRGKLVVVQGEWAQVEAGIARIPPEDRVDLGAGSPYAPNFRNGASIFPRVLFMVERKEGGPLGTPALTPVVRSQRSVNEKKPWRDVLNREAAVEANFIWPTYLGECVLPYRLRPPLEAVIPRDTKGLMDGENPRLIAWPLLRKWWLAAEQLWLEHRSSEKLSLLERLNYHGALDSQFPCTGTRVVYCKSGMHLSAARIPFQRAVIDHTLYWINAFTDAESYYLCAILNAATITRRVRPLMSYGKDERHVDKYVWKLPIPRFDATVARHARLATLGQQVEREVTGLDIADDVHFPTARHRIREALERMPEGQEIEQLVDELLGPA